MRAAVVVAASAFLLAAMSVLGIAGVLKFVDAERQRDLQNWQIRLGIVADSRAAAVADWLAAQRDTVNGLAENASVQLFLTEHAAGRGKKQSRKAKAAIAAQAEYLGNLLAVTAARGGYDAPALGPDVPANVERVPLSGLAVLDADGEPLVATPEMPDLGARMARLIADTPRGEPGIIDLHAGPGDRPSMGFLAPVFALQGDAVAENVVGFVVGLRPAGDALFARLRQPGEILDTAEAVLVRADGGSIEYLSPLRDGSPALGLRLVDDTPDLAAAAMLAQPGGFGIYRDYAGHEVLATSRALAGVPWVLMRKVDRTEALADTDRRLHTLLIVLLLGIGAAGFALIAVWRHGTSVRASAAAERFRRSTERFEALSRFLRTVADGQPTSISVIDGDGNYTFANALAARQAGLLADEMLGKNMRSVLGPARAEAFERLNEKVTAEDGVSEVVKLVGDDDKRRVVKADHVPLAGDTAYAGATLMIHNDVTELVTERERREDTLRQLIATLLGVVDRRDPYSANHSARVAEVAHAIAGEMSLNESEQETAAVAGALMNLGKILVPEAVLTKTEGLTPDELATIRDSILTSADLLEGVPFDGPVVETIRQLQETWDGSGTPQALAGERILLSARIVAVANAFVGMISPRAYRGALSFEQAAEALMADAGRRYDHRPVLALLNYLDNRGGRQAWAHFAAPPPPATPGA